MTYEQHPLSAAFPAMSVEQFEAYRDGVLPMTHEVRGALLASAWFRGLNKSQRAIYGVKWFHHLAVGSNQHRQRIKTNTKQFAAEQTQELIGRAGRA